MERYFCDEMKSKKLKISAVDARAEAQKIAFGPVVFQVVRLARKFGLLAAIHKNRMGLSLQELMEVGGLSEYSTKILVEMMLTGDVLDLQDGKYKLSKVGYFLHSDEMTRVNMDFVHDVNYKGLFYLEVALKDGNPAGLKVFGDWKTIYAGLSELKPEIQKSWFAFDHYYSDNAFEEALEIVFSHKPKHLIDVGGNTGKWALQCAGHDPDVNITIVDLAGQVEMAEKNISQAGMSSRVKFIPHDMINPSKEFPKSDAIWMSQFLDCFSEEEIVRILTHASKSMNEETNLFIMENYWDNQKFAGAAFSLAATSVYFTVMANGNSKIYGLEEMTNLIHKSGLKVIETYDDMGVGHTILKCRKQ